MNRYNGWALAAALLLALLADRPAPGQGGVIREDQFPWGPDGTIGRGTDNYPRNLTYLGGGRYTYRPPHPAFAGFWYSGDYQIQPPAPAFAGPYPTGRYCEPGDGYRYPVYYNPITGAYLYYPVRR